MRFMSRGNPTARYCFVSSRECGRECGDRRTGKTLRQSSETITGIAN
jgi:hypothetical protein